MWYNFNTPPPFFYPPNAPPTNKNEIKEFIRTMKAWQKFNEEQKKSGDDKKKDDKKDNGKQLSTADWFFCLTVVCVFMQPLYLWLAISLLKAVR